MDRAAARWALIPVVGLLAACGDSPDPKADGGVPAPSISDSAGVRLVDYSAGAFDAVPEWRAKRVLTLGESDDESARSRFLHVNGVRLLPDGRVLVVSDGSKQLLLFDGDHDALATFGRSGRGPGEFWHLDMLESSRRDEIVAVDALARRLMLIGLDTSQGRDPARVLGPVRATMSLIGGEIGPVHHRYRFADGAMLVTASGEWPAPAAQGVVRDTMRVVIQGADGTIITDLGWHDGDDRVLRLRSNGGLTGGEPPYGRQLLITAREGAVVLSSSGPWQLEWFTLDSVTPRRTRMRAVGARRPVTAEVRQAFRDRVLRDVRDEYGINEWTMLSNDDVFPDVLPAFDQLHFDALGRLWVRASVMEGDTLAHWTIFADATTVLARVDLPAAFTPHDITAEHVAGVWKDEDGGEQVHVYRVSPR
jgi:hypothetical protein